MLTLRGLTLTAAAPRIIVPLFARSLDALRPLAAAAQADPAAELVELRLDPLPAADHTAMPCAALPAPPGPPRFSASITLTAPPPPRR